MRNEISTHFKQNPFLLLFLSLFLLGTFGIQTNLQAQCISTFPYLEDFEGGKAGWADSSFLVPPLNTANSPNTWAFGDPLKIQIQGAASGDSCWVTGGLGFQRYASQEESYVQSPCFDFTSLTSPVIAMSIWYDIENPFDGASLMSSIDSGVTWQVVGSNMTGSNWYNFSNITAGPGTAGTSAGQNLMGWSGSVASSTSSGGWIRAQHELTGLGGQSSVIFRVAFAADPITNHDGFAFDDVTIVEDYNVFLGPDRTLCFGDVAFLDLGGFANVVYSWKNRSDSTQVIRVATQGTSVGCVFDSVLNLTFCDTINISVSSLALLPLPDSIICPGDSIVLNMGTGAATHLWRAFDSTLNMFVIVSNNQRLTSDTTGVYWATISDNTGCTDEDTITVQVDNVPTISLPPPDTICVGDARILCGPNSAPNTSYVWRQNGNSFASTQCIFASSPGSYDLLLTTPAGCSTADTTLLDVKLAPVINLGPDHIECDSVVLNAVNQGSSYFWTPSMDVTQTVTYYPPFTATVQVTNRFGCAARDTISIALGQPPVVNLPPDTVVCNAAAVTLDASGPNQPIGTSFQWSTSVTSIFSSETISQAGFYTVKVTHPNGCSVIDSVNVTISRLAVDLGPDTTVCDGKSIVLDAAFPGATYQWANGPTTPSIIVTTGGNYSVTLMDSLGCSSTDNIQVAQKAPYIGSFTVDTAVVRLNNQHTFRANAPAGTISYKWDFGDGTSGNGAIVTHTYTSLDTFDVCLMISDGQCRDTSCSEAGNKLIFISIQDHITSSLEVYPNPNQGNFVVEMELLKPAETTLELLDLNGRQVMQRKLDYGLTHKESFNVKGAAKGMYLLKISTPEGSTYRKIVIR